MTNKKNHLKKCFREQALPDFKILQSRFIKINGKSYAVVGQKTLNSFLFSFFDVFDSYGERADAERATAVYKYISMFQITELLEQMEGLLNYSNGDTTFISQDFKGRYGEDINELLRANDQIHSLLQELIHEKEKILNNEEWKEDHFQSFQLAWESFWDAYEPRLKILFEFREYVWEHNKNVAVQETNLQNVYQEADVMYLLFSESLPADQSFMTNIDDLIQISEELGRVSANGDNTSFLTTFERFSMHLFKSVYRIFLFVILPASLLLMVYGLFNGSYHFRTSFNVLIITFILFTVHVTDKHGRKTKMIRRFKQIRKEKLGHHQLIQTKYSKAYETIKESEQKSAESIHEFVATPTILWRGMLVVSIGMCIIGIGILAANKESHDYGYGWITVAAIILLLRIFLPFTGFANIRFQLTPDGLKRGKKAKTFLRNIFEIRVNQSGSIVAIDIGLQYRQKYKIKKEYRQKTKEQLEIWCDKHSIKFKDRLYF